MEALKKQVNKLLNDNKSKAKLVFDVFIIQLILISVVMLILDILKVGDERTNLAFLRVDQAILAIFLVEFLGRLWVIESPKERVLEMNAWEKFKANLEARIRFILTPLGLIDLLALLPLVPHFRVLRVLRLLRLLKLLRYQHRFLQIVHLLRYNSLLYIITFSFVWVAVLLAALGVFVVEKDIPESAFHNFGTAIWWALVTITTVGYGDIVPVTPEGKLIASLLMVSGLITLSLFAGVVSGTLVGQLLDIRKDSFLVQQLSDHIIVLGWNDKGPKLINELLKMTDNPSSLVVMAPCPRPENLRLDVLFIRGEPIMDEDMGKIHLELAQSVVILTNTLTSENTGQADAYTILSVFTVRTYENKTREQGVNRLQRIHICAELQNAENREHLITAGTDEIILTGEIGTYLLAQATLVSGISKIYDRLLKLDGDELYTTSIRPEVLVEAPTFDNAAIHLRKKNRVTLVGLVRDQKVILNPQEPLTLKETDRFIVLAANSDQAHMV